MVEAICWAAGGLIVLFMGMVYPQPQVIWNLRFAAFAVAVAATMWAARQVQGRSAQLHIGASVLATVLALTAICFEISTFWSRAGRATSSIVPPSGVNFTAFDK